MQGQGYHLQGVRMGMVGRENFRCICVVLGLALVLISGSGEAKKLSKAADQIWQLIRDLRPSQPVKKRVEAVVALGKLEDRRSVKALLRALRDKSAQVRAQAAIALGAFEDDSLWVPLHEASEDSDPKVRRLAKRALKKLVPPREKTLRKLSARYRQLRWTIQKRGGEHNKATADGRIHVRLRSSTDDSPGRASKRQRSERARILEENFREFLEQQTELTLDNRVAAENSLSTVAIDLSIVRHKKVTKGKWVELQCQIRVALSDERGKMISFLSGGANVQIAKKNYTKAHDIEMREDAIGGSAQGIQDDLLRNLRATRAPE